MGRYGGDAGGGDYEEVLHSIRLDTHPPDDFRNMDQVARGFALEARNARFGFDLGGYEYPAPDLNDAGRATYVAFVEEELRTFE